MRVVFDRVGSDGLSATVAESAPAGEAVRRTARRKPEKIGNRGTARLGQWFDVWFVHDDNDECIRTVAPDWRQIDNTWKGREGEWLICEWVSGNG